MDQEKIGVFISTLRKEQGMTQQQLADAIGVSNKTISKWETGRGLPDITLLEPLAGALSVSVPELLSGQTLSNRNRGGNMLRGKFYVCPVCGNAIHATGEAMLSCCGVSLPPLEAEDGDCGIEKIEDELFVTLDHPMTREHHISFFAYVTLDRTELVKLYPEGNPEARFFNRGRGKLYWYCNRHGLFCREIKRL